MAMTKYVSIRTTVAVRNTNPPICGTYKGIMTTGDILKCLCKRAFVEEILPDGSTIKLNMKNYYTDNGAGLDALKTTYYKEAKVEKKENPVKPVVEEVKVEESAEIKAEETPKEEVVVEETKVEEKVEEAKAEKETPKEEVAEEVKEEAAVVEEKKETPAKKPQNNNKKNTSNTKKTNNK